MPGPCSALALPGVLLLAFLPFRTGAAEQEPDENGFVAPVVETLKDDYAEARKHFTTRLARKAPAPARGGMPSAPADVLEVEFPSGPLSLRAWLAVPEGEEDRPHPAVVFLHGGFAFGAPDWDMAAPYREAGFVVLAPILRGENGQPGTFSLFYDEVEDVLAAAEFLRGEPYVDADRLFVAGHSVGGTLALLAAQASDRFAAAASFSGSPDQVIYCKLGLSAEQIPFDATDANELAMRSPLAFAASFKCPVRMYYGTREPHFHLSTVKTTELARAAGLDAACEQIEGSHEGHVQASMARSLAFFEGKRARTPTSPR